MSDWKWWQNAINGDVGPIHENEPQCGYYRARSNKYGDEPVAIWNNGETMLAIRGFDQNQIDPGEIWTFVCSNPIEYEEYNKAIINGCFSDEPPAPKTHNLPDDPCEALAIELEGEKELAEEFLSEPVTDQTQADKAAAWSKKLSAISKKADDQRKVEKQPHVDAGKAVDAKWNPIRDEAKDLSTRLKRHLDDWLREQARIESERQRKAQEEADRKRKEAEEAAAKAQSEQDAIEAEKAMEAAKKAEQDAKERNAQAGRTGSKVALRTFISATITDYDKLLNDLKDRQEIKDLVQSLANRAAKSGVKLDGMEIHEEKRAA